MTRIALVSLGDATDPAVWSGIPHAVRRALTGLGAEVVDVGPLRVPASALRHRAFVLARSVGRCYRYELDGPVIRAFGRQAADAIEGVDVDAVLSTSVLPVGALAPGVPVAVWCDATIENLAQTYADFTRMPRRQRHNAEAAERRGIARADVLAYASPWAAASAVDRFGADPARVLDAPFGAALEPELGFDVEGAIASRGTSSLHLVWIGADWERKRGELAVAIAGELVDRGVQVRLTMIGAGPPSGEVLPPFVSHRGFIGQRTAGGRALLSGVLRSAHFLLLPSRAEGFGIVVAEANAHAVPCLGADVGGIPGAIRDGENGRLLPVEAPAAAYADLALAALAEPAGYADLARRSHAAWRTRLNWTASCTAILGRLGVTPPDAPRESR